jgi:hypothetical protein
VFKEAVMLRHKLDFAVKLNAKSSAQDRVTQGIDIGPCA